jgi:chromate transporter
MEKLKTLLKLFLTMFKIGLFTFGGGYAMIPQIKEVVIEKEKWLTEDDMLELLAIAESTPGPIAINMATYIGFQRKKLLGSIFSTLGVILPSMIIVFIISLFFDKFLANQYVAYAFVGIKACVAFLILKAGLGMIKKMERKLIPILVFAIVLSLMIIFELFAINFSSIILILIGGVIGIITNALVKAKKCEVNE